MEQTYGDRLQAARKRAGFTTQESLGDAIGVSGRTIRAWEKRATPPDDPTKRDALHKVLGEFDTEGDPVEVALYRSELVEWRRDTVTGFYKMHLTQQRQENVG